MKNKLLAKCTAEIIQLDDRKERGAEHIEIHLRDNEPSNLSEVEEMTRNIIESGLKASVIHSPMSRQFILESFGTREAKERMHLVSKLAQNMHELKGEGIVVVIHMELTMEQIKAYGMLRGIEELFRELLDTYPGVSYAIENLSLINYEKGELTVRGSFYNSPVIVAKYLRNKLQTDRVGTVLDTCHALSSVRALKSLERYGYRSDLSLEQYLEDYSETLLLVHLSNALNLGFKGDHGQGFETKEDKILLHHILSKLSRLEYHGPITLEVNENNPRYAVRYSALMENFNTEE